MKKIALNNQLISHLKSFATAGTVRAQHVYFNSLITRIAKYHLVLVEITSLWNIIAKCS